MVERKGSKIKRKVWVSIIGPKIFNKATLGDIPLEEPKLLLGRKISCNLSHLTHDMKKQQINIKCTISKIDQTKAETEVYGYYMAAAALKRMTRRGKQRINNSFCIITQDKKRIRIKPIAIPIKKVKSSIATAIQNSMKALLTKVVNGNTFDTIIADTVSSKLQRYLKDELKKIYPVRILEFGAVHLEALRRPGQKDEVKDATQPKPAPDKEAKKEADKEVNKVADKEVNKVADKEVNKVADKEVNKVADKEVNKVADKEVNKEAPAELVKEAPIPAKETAEVSKKDEAVKTEPPKQEA